MNHLFLKLYIKLENLAKDEEGQDLVEYALLVFRDCPRAAFRA